MKIKSISIVIATFTLLAISGCKTPTTQAPGQSVYVTRGQSLHVATRVIDVESKELLQEAMGNIRKLQFLFYSGRGHSIEVSVFNNEDIESIKTSLLQYPVVPRGVIYKIDYTNSEYVWITILGPILQDEAETYQKHYTFRMKVQELSAEIMRVLDDVSSGIVKNATIRPKRNDLKQRETE
ncbi:hypothetical protein P4C99_21335 [Pontiellaceae bacterium B1224]|nr:hypothetical protein [Pontiellaceae bacterium B1224]